MTPLLPQLPAREALLADIRRMHEHAAANRWSEALAIAERLEAASAPLEVRSAHLAWAIAVLHDNLGNLVLALAFALKAVNLDPLAPAVDDSLGIIVDRVRKSLSTEKWDEEVSPRLYATMAENGLADAACHVAWANHLYANGHHEEALAVAQSVVMLSPRCGAGWQVVEAAAVALGRDDVAHDAGLRYTVAAREDPEVDWTNAKWGVA
jgi:hypothetical protein